MPMHVLPSECHHAAASDPTHKFQADKQTSPDHLNIILQQCQLNCMCDGMSRQWQPCACRSAWLLHLDGSMQQSSADVINWGCRYTQLPVDRAYGTGVLAEVISPDCALLGQMANIQIQGAGCARDGAEVI